MNKIIIVTGASRGIGREIAKELARKGYTVIANYNKSENQAQELKEELEKENIKIDIFKADISRKNEAQELVEYTINKTTVTVSNIFKYEYENGMFKLLDVIRPEPIEEEK